MRSMDPGATGKTAVKHWNGQMRWQIKLNRLGNLWGQTGGTLMKMINPGGQRIKSEHDWKSRRADQIAAGRSRWNLDQSWRWNVIILERRYESGDKGSGGRRIKMGIWSKDRKYWGNHGGLDEMASNQYHNIIRLFLFFPDQLRIWILSPSFSSMVANSSAWKYI